MQVGKLGREAPAAYIYLFFKPYPWPVAHRPLAPNQAGVSAPIPQPIHLNLSISIKSV